MFGRRARGRVDRVVLRRALADAVTSGYLFVPAFLHAASTDPTVEAIREVGSSAVGGRRLSEILASRPDFDRCEAAAIRAGEESGRVPEVLVALAERAEREEARRRAERESLLRPVAALVLVWVVSLVLLFLSCPPVAEAVRSWDGILPLGSSSRLVLFLADHRTLALVLLFSFPLFPFVFRRLARHTRSGRRLLRRVRLLSRREALDSWSLFAELLALLVEAGVPLSEARLRARSAVPSDGFRIRLRIAWSRRGDPLDALLFPFPHPSSRERFVDADALASDLREAAELARVEVRHIAYARDVRVSTALLVAAGAAAFLAFWSVIGPLMALTAGDPFS